MEGAGVECLEKGFLNVLPNDPSGRAVIFFDRIRAIPAVATRESVVSATSQMQLVKRVHFEECVWSNTPVPFALHVGSCRGW